MHMKLILMIIFSLNILNNKIASLEDKTSEVNIIDNLNKIYNSLETPNIYLFKTNKFDCRSNGCTSSNFTNIGNISTYEYNIVGGNDSYLSIPNDFYGLEGNSNKVITPFEIKDTDENTNSGLRANEYVKKGVMVTGSGTKSDPWRFVKPNYKIVINIKNATINGNSNVSETINDFEKEYNVIPNEEYHVFRNITCDGIADYQVINNKLIFSNIRTDLTCTLNYRSLKHFITLVVNGGTVSNNNLEVMDEENSEFDVVPNDKHALKNVSCTNDQEISYIKNKFTLKNVIEDSVCILNYELVDTTFAYKESPQTYEIPYDGYYTLEAWGARGSGSGGYGSYVKGEIYLTKGTVLTINTGGTNGYNGGGDGYYKGGGSSTIKTTSIIMAAAGGGGGSDGTAGGNGTGAGGASSGGSDTNGGPGTAGTNGGGGGSGYNYEKKENCSSCYYGENTCQGGYTSETYNHGTGSITYTCGDNGWSGVGTYNVSCGSGGTKSFSCGSAPTGACTKGATTSVACSGYCTRQVYKSCLTGSNTCSYGCDVKKTPYNSGKGGTNIIDNSITLVTSSIGANSSNGKVQISYKEGK